MRSAVVRFLVCSFQLYSLLSLSPSTVNGGFPDSFFLLRSPLGPTFHPVSPHPALLPSTSPASPNLISAILAGSPVSSRPSPPVSVSPGVSLPACRLPDLPYSVCLPSACLRSGLRCYYRGFRPGKGRRFFFACGGVYRPRPPSLPAH